MKFLLLIAFIASGAAFANGQLFFAEHPDAAHGAAFFGFVKDANGDPIAGAEVTFYNKAETETRIIKTDVSGYFLFPGFKKGVDPKSVRIGCAKKGYKLVSKRIRPPVGHVTATSPIEIDCLLKH